MESDNKTYLSWGDVFVRARKAARRIRNDFSSRVELAAYPVPRGGVYAAQAVQTAMAQAPLPITLNLVTDSDEADVVVDDLIDSGATMKRFVGRPFYVLLDKREEGPSWVVFPWEQMNNEDGPQENVRRLIEYIGDDPNREGLRETPDRVVRSYVELFGGYRRKPGDVVKVFEDDSCDEMVAVRNVEFYSTCEHHMLPFFGKAHIAYIPNGRVIGVSKLVRLLEVFSRRLQIQERLCQQVTGALDEFLKPKGSACILEARHLCMTSRGVAKQGSMMVTSSLTGVFREAGNMARQELLGMLR